MYLHVGPWQQSTVCHLTLTYRTVRRSADTSQGIGLVLGARKSEET